MKYMLLMYANESLTLETPEEQQAVAPEVALRRAELSGKPSVAVSHPALSRARQ